MQYTSAFERLVKIMDDLREQCPWDKKQTIQTLRQLTIEETYELTDAITDKNWKGIKEELGDILLHIIISDKIKKVNWPPKRRLQKKITIKQKFIVFRIYNFVKNTQKKRWLNTYIKISE